MAPFQPGNKLGARPKGARNRLARKVLEDLMLVWEEPAMAGDKPMLDANGNVVTRGVAALRVMSRQEPSKFAALYGSLVPKELWIDQGISAWSDEELHDMIEELRQKVLGAKKELPMIELKVSDVIRPREIASRS